MTEQNKKILKIMQTNKHAGFKMEDKKYISQGYLTNWSDVQRRPSMKNYQFIYQKNKIAILKNSWRNTIVLVIENVVYNNYLVDSEWPIMLSLDAPTCDANYLRQMRD